MSATPITSIGCLISLNTIIIEKSTGNAYYIKKIEDLDNATIEKYFPNIGNEEMISLTRLKQNYIITESKRNIF